MSHVQRAEAAPSRTAGAALRLDRVSKSFGANLVLGNIDLRVPAGQFLAIVGRSGSGKSSLLRMISGLDRPTSGRILFDDVPPDRGSVRIMFQEPRLLPWARVLGNVIVGLPGNRADAAGRARAMETLGAVGLANRAGDWPTVLSGGQKQRVALARALVSRPRVLLFDEPLGALDALTRLDMQGLIESAWRQQGFTAVLVTHDVTEAVRLADRVIVIEEGAVTLDLRHEAPHPRTLRSPAAAALEDEVLARLMSPA